MIPAQKLKGYLAALVIPLGLTLLVAALALGGDLARDCLAFDRARITHGQWWRLLTGNLVHLGPYHALLNLLGLLALLVLCPETLRPAVWFRRLLAMGLGVGLGLYVFVPELSRYVGLSGVLHGLFLLGLWPMARRGDFIALACLAYLVGKLGWEWMVGVPLSDEQAIGGRVIVESHLLGTLSGCLYAVLATLLTNRYFKQGESEQ